MTTLTLTIDDALLDDAKTLGEHQTVPEAIQAALNEYVRIRRQMAIFELAGTIEYDPDYDYKEQRNRK